MKLWIGKKLVWLAAKLGGVSTLIEWLCEYATSLLNKIKDKEEFAAYAEDVSQLGLFLEGCFNRHTKWMSENKRAAANATIEAIRHLADAMKDCTVTKEEVDRLVDDVIAAIEAWKVADAKPAQVIGVSTPLAVALCLALTLTGCKAFYENAGSHTVVGSLTAPVEVTEPTSSCTVRALYAMDGADVYTAKDSLVKIRYANAYTNNYFYIVKTQGQQDLAVEIEPLETGSVTNGTDGNDGTEAKE